MPQCKDCKQDLADDDNDYCMNCTMKRIVLTDIRVLESYMRKTSLILKKYLEPDTDKPYVRKQLSIMQRDQNMRFLDLIDDMSYLEEDA